MFENKNAEIRDLSLYRDARCVLTNVICLVERSMDFLMMQMTANNRQTEKIAFSNLLKR